MLIKAGLAASQQGHGSRINLRHSIVFLRSKFTPPSTTAYGPRVTIQLVRDKNISLVLSTATSSAASGLPPHAALPSRPLCCPLSSPPPPPEVATAKRRICFSTPRSGTWAWASPWRGRHANLGFQRGTGLGPCSGAQVQVYSHYPLIKS